MEPNHAIEDQFSELVDEFGKNLTLDEEQQEPPQEVEEEEEDDDDDDDESDDGEFEFFIGGGDPHSPVSAEEIFQNGQIRPIFPFFGENSDEATTSYGPPVRKLFVVSSPERDDVAEGPYCAWSSSSTANKSPAETPAPEMSQKSNSTGFSKLWKVRDLLVRSHSDGKDAFVFLKGEEKAGEAASFRDKMKMKKKKKVNVANIEVAKGETTTSNLGKKKGKGKPKSAYEVLYGKREKKTGKSYLPYRQDLVGFFTNASGMSRNVHPY